jgi:hypothetical protein
MEITALAVDMEPFMSQAVAQRNNKQASENEMSKKEWSTLPKMKKRTRPGWLLLCGKHTSCQP